MTLLNPDMSQLASDRTLRTALRHIMVICTGLNREFQGRPFLRRTYETGEFVLQVERMAPYTLAIYGAIDNQGAVTVNRVLQHIKENFDPEGKLILFGFSSGGYNVLRVCQILDGWRYRYGRNGQRGSLEAPGAHTADAGSKIRVDLLITVDPCASLLYGESWDASVPKCVKWAQNWYQRKDNRSEGYKGVPLTGIYSNYRNAAVSNPHVNHDNIMSITRDWALRRLSEALPH